MMKMRKRHRGGWIFITLKTNTMKNQCKNSANMFYNILFGHKIANN